MGARPVTQICHFNGFTFDSGTGVLVHSDGTEVTLRPKAAATLQTLLDHHGRTVSRDTLMNTVWPGLAVTDDSITQCISEIRRAVGGKAAEILRTSPKRGYRILSTPVGRDPIDVRSGALQQTSEPFPIDIPSLAVLPFINVNRQPDYEYISDGMTDDMIAQLAHNRSFLVIARGSSFSYKSRSVSVRKVGRELGARYVLEGGVRSTPDRVRINAHLSEAESEVHIWAGSYDADLTDIFHVQDVLVRQVVTQIAPAILQIEQVRALRKPPQNLNAWEAYQRGLWHSADGSSDQADVAADLFRRAIMLDPQFAEPHAMLARYLNGEATRGGGRSFRDGLNLAEEEARIALRIDPNCVAAHTALAWVFHQRGDALSALECAERAIAISPSFAPGYLAKGHTLTFAGRLAEARLGLEMALKLDPRGQTALGALHHIAVSFYLERDYQSAERASRKAILAHPKFPRTYPVLAASVGQLGRKGEAHDALCQALVMAAEYFRLLTAGRPPWYRAEDYAHLMDGLRKAGWTAGS